jgi:hypothetical protein
MFARNPARVGFPKATPDVIIFCAPLTCLLTCFLLIIFLYIKQNKINNRGRKKLKDKTNYYYNSCYLTCFIADSNLNFKLNQVKINFYMT